MNKKMVVCAIVSAIGIAGIVLGAGEDVDASRGVFGQVNLKGPNPLQINGTNVTVSAAQINAAGGGTTATLAPTTLNVSSNMTVLGQPKFTVVATAGTLTNGPAFTTTWPANAVTNAFKHIVIMVGTGYYDVVGMQVGAP